MDFKSYQKKSYTAIQPHTCFKDEVLNWVVGLSEEVGEVMNHTKHAFWGNEQIDRVAIAKEVGDVLWYLSALCTVLQLDFQTIANLNIKKLEHRFKKGVFSEQQSKNRHKAENDFKNTEIYKELIKELTQK